MFVSKRKPELHTQTQTITIYIYIYKTNPTQQIQLTYILNSKLEATVQCDILISLQITKTTQTLYPPHKTLLFKYYLHAFRAASRSRSIVVVVVIFFARVFFRIKKNKPN